MEGVPDPRQLEGRPEGEKKLLQAREFFWDSIVLYVVSAIIGLAAIDVVAEFIRGSEVECYSSVEDINGDIRDYVNSLCSGSLPVTEYFPVFIVVHGILIATPHYLWLNHFGGDLDFFFQLVSSLKRLRDEKTGEYPEKNVIIADHLEAAFTTYKRNWMFHVYRAKLLLQWLLAVFGLALAIFYFTDFDEIFSCPRTISETLDDSWPLNSSQQISCVFTSLRLLASIRIADIILLTIVTFGLTWSLIWSGSIHATELGSKRVAAFAFQSGLAPRYYVPNLSVQKCCKCCRNLQHRYSTSVPWLSRGGPHISNDLDFMVVKLFRTDGGLGHVLKEVQVLKEIKNLNNDEQRTLNLHRREQVAKGEGELIEKDIVKADLKWRFNKGGSPDGVYNRKEWRKLPEFELLEVPDSIRGAVLGFSAYAASNTGALCVTFGSPSIGLAGALRRVFSRVGSVNFSPLYRNPDELVSVKEDSGVVTLVSPDDILTGDGDRELLMKAEQVWRPGKRPGEQTVTMKSNFVVIGPIDKDLHKTTVNLFIELVEKYISEQAILLTIVPVEIAGKDVSKSKEFKTYKPPEKYFTDLGHKVRVRSGEADDLAWPPKAPQASLTTSPNNQSPLTQTPSTTTTYQSFPLLPASTSAASQTASASSNGLPGPATPSSSATSTPHTSSSNEYKSSHDLSVLVGDAHSKFTFSLYKRTGSGKSSGRNSSQAVPKEEEDPVRSKLPALHPKVPNVPPPHQSVPMEESPM